MWVCSIGIVLRKMGETEKALTCYNKSLEIKIKVHGQDHPLVATTRNKCAHFLCFFPVGWVSEIVLAAALHWS